MWSIVHGIRPTRNLFYLCSRGLEHISIISMSNENIIGGRCGGGGGVELELCPGELHL